MTYIITFDSHFGAIAFSNACAKQNIKVTLMPVPRFLSSSCGTCAKIESDAESDARICDLRNSQTEQIVRIDKEAMDKQSCEIVWKRDENA